MNRMIAALFLCIVSAGAYAQASPAPGTTPDAPHAARMARAEQQLQSRFANANTTRDGKLTREQAATGMPMVARHFDEIDTQRAGYITLPQIEAFMAKQMMSR